MSYANILLLKILIKNLNARELLQPLLMTFLFSVMIAIEKWIFCLLSALEAQK